MKIGVSTLALYPQSLKKILECLEENKVDYCEIINEFPYHKLEDGILESYNVKLSLHAPLSDINLASHNQRIRRSSLEEVKKSMNLAVDWNAEVVVVHPGSMPIMGRKIKQKIFQFNFESLLACSSYAQDCGIFMCVENMPDIDGLLYQDLNKLDSLVRDIDAYMTLDVGHAYNNGFSEEEMLKYSRIKHIHLSDNDGSFDQHNALGDGNINFQSLLKTLKRINYHDVLVIEVKEPIDVFNSLDYLKMEMRFLNMV
jgi:sugar phosphate isomerase/epimerase